MSLISLLMCAKFEGNLMLHLCFMAIFCQYAKKKKKENFWRLIFQEWLVQFTSNLVRSFPWYASTCTVNSVLLGLDITELQMGIKAYFVYHVNILTFFVDATFSWVALHTTVCLCVHSSYIFIITILYMINIIYR